MGPGFPIFLVIVGFWAIETGRKDYRCSLPYYCTFHHDLEGCLQHFLKLLHDMQMYTVTMAMLITLTKNNKWVWGASGWAKDNKFEEAMSRWQ